MRNGRGAEELYRREGIRLDIGHAEMMRVQALRQEQDKHCVPGLGHHLVTHRLISRRKDEMAAPTCLAASLVLVHCSQFAIVTCHCNPLSLPHLTP